MRDQHYYFFILGNSEPSVSVKNSPKSEEPTTADQPPIITTPPSLTAEEIRKSKAEITKLVPKCLDAMRECLQRFIQHYKALYRMAHYYCHSTCNKVIYMFFVFF